MIKLLDYIFGTCQFCVKKQNAERALNLLHKNMIYVKKMPKSDGEYFSFVLALSKADKVGCLLDKSGIKVYSIKRKGLPSLVLKYRKRYGLFIGALIFCFILWFSKFIVWEIDFSGNENISDSVVEKQLSEVGFGVGSYIPSIDFYTLGNEFIMASDDFSFISVNMDGTKAHVELRERKKKQEKIEYKASNIVAKYSGVIENMTVYSGQTVVEKESVVKEGDLLVSGFLEKQNGFDIVRSTGSVYAYVTRDFVSEIPFEKTVKEYNDTTQKRIELQFFGKSFKIYSNIDGSIKNYDETVDRERVVLFDRIKLPLVLTTTIHREYETKTVTIDEQTARKYAEKEMTEILLNELSDSEVLERKTREEITDEKYSLYCSVYCLADIAEEKEIALN